MQIDNMINNFIHERLDKKDNMMYKGLVVTDGDR